MLRMRPEQAFYTVWVCVGRPLCGRPTQTHTVWDKAGLGRNGPAGNCPEGPWRYFHTSLKATSNISISLMPMNGATSPPSP